MTTISLPSKRISVVDIPEVSTLKSTFQYNFFTFDERVNDNGSAPVSILAKPAESFEVSLVESIDFNRTVPRYVWLQWNPVNVGNRPDLIKKINISDNLKKVKYEDEFTTDDYTHLSFQDSGKDEKLLLYVRKILEQTGTKTKVSSPQEIAKFVNSNTENVVDSTTLSNITNKPKDIGIRFFKNNDGQEEETKQSIFEELANIKTSIQLNNKVIAHVLNSVKEDVISPYSDEIVPILDKAKDIQSNAIATRSSTVFSGDDYDFEIDNYILVKKIDSSGYDSILQTIGFIIEKTEYLSDRHFCCTQSNNTRKSYC